MKRARMAVGAIGLFLGLAAITAVGTPLGGVATDALVAALGNDYLAAVVIASLGVLVAIPILISSRSGTLDQASLPAPEVSLAMPAPGDDFDDALDSSVLFVPYLDSDRKDEVRSELRDAAIDVLARTSASSRRDAISQVVSGEWTEDAAAAAFLADGKRGFEFGARASALARGDNLFQHRARRTARAIVERANGGGA
ncbi:DUF7269 family protein [Haloarchaeobius sp. DFWS5]|uniref:DUF7269 family protein n=1 Tax=Haloarchaeobius sp. DFWS5 TaxID=3446114 RepID=UPI003EBF49AD